MDYQINIGVSVLSSQHRNARRLEVWRFENQIAGIRSMRLDRGICDSPKALQAPIACQQKVFLAAQKNLLDEKLISCSRHSRALFYHHPAPFRNVRPNFSENFLRNLLGFPENKYG